MASALFDFESFESKFKSIESKIKSKTERVHQLHESDVEAIKTRYDENLIENVFAVNLNEQRDVMLKLVEQKRVQNISQVNEIVENLDKTANAKTVLIEKSKLILQLDFKKSRIPTFDCILNTFKINHPLDFDKFYKYTDLIIKKKKFCLNLPDGYRPLRLHDVDNICHSISSDKLFLYVDANSLGCKMIIIDKEGNILHSKDEMKLPFTNGMTTRSQFLFTHNKILHFLREVNKKINVYVFDFKLELVKLFKFNESYGDTFSLNNNALGLQTDYTDAHGNETAMNINKNGYKILIYNFDTMNTNYIALQRKKENEPFFFIKSVHYMVHFNKDYLYFMKFKKNKKEKTLTILNRSTGVKVRDIGYTIISQFYNTSIKHDNYNGIMIINDNCNYFNVYKSDGDFLFSIPFCKSFLSLAFTPYQTNIYGYKYDKNREKYIEYFEY